MSSENNTPNENLHEEGVTKLRETLPTVFINVSTAVLIWIFARLVFVPMAQGINFAGYPVPAILNFAVVIALAFLVLSVFYQIRGVAEGLSSIIANQFGKVSRQRRRETFANYKTFLSNLLYVIAVALAFLLFADFLTLIHPGLTAVVLIAIFVWSVFAIFRGGKAIADEISRGADRVVEEIERSEG